MVLTTVVQNHVVTKNIIKKLLNLWQTLQEKMTIHYMCILRYYMADWFDNVEQNNII